MNKLFSTVFPCLLVGSGVYRMFKEEYALAAALFALACAVHQIFSDRATIILRERRRGPE
jgi:hypothetical protein